MKIINKRHILPPWNLCNNLLHKFFVDVTFCKLDHVFQITYGIARRIRKLKLDIRRKVLDKFRSPRFTSVNRLSNTPVEHNKLSIGAARNAILRAFNLALNCGNRFQIFRLVHEHNAPRYGRRKTSMKVGYFSYVFVVVLHEKGIERKNDVCQIIREIARNGDCFKNNRFFARDAF